MLILVFDSVLQGIPAVTRQLLTLGLTFLALTNPLSAHPGHGNAAAQDGLTHYLTSPTHLGTGLLIVLAVAAVARIAINAFGRSDEQR